MMTRTDNIHEYTVSELSGALKRTVEDNFGNVRVRAELSGVKLHSSGHLYLSLKDERATMDGICWRGTVAKLRFKPEDGLEVVVRGRLSTYPARSRYQIIIEHMEPAGAGALMALLEERKKKLAAEGLFAPDRKRPIPWLPDVVGVVTSPTGAVIRDILHRLSDRFPRRVILWPVPVQGEGAAEKIADAIRGFNALDGSKGIPRPDVLIIARGGGSIEDLWAFNEEVVARAAAESTIPLISAVGHETDTTLIDLVSDRRAPTPTAAAEIAVPVRADLLARTTELHSRLDSARRRIFDQFRDRIAGLARGLPRPHDLLGLARQRFDDLADRLPRGLRHVTLDRSAELARLEGRLRPGNLRQMVIYKRQKADSISRRLDPACAHIMTHLERQLQSNSRLLETLSYQGVLARGYTVLRNKDNQPVTSVRALKPGQPISAELKDGQLMLIVAGPTPQQAQRQTKKPAVPEQGSLL